MATTVTAPASLGHAPRFGMGWVTWRQHRAAIGPIDHWVVRHKPFRLVCALRNAGVMSC
jgi:hypothetical protein